MYDFKKLVDKLKGRDDLPYIFSNEKFIHNGELNRLGLHIFRSIKSRLYYRSKLDLSKEHVRQFYHEGALVMEGLVGDSDIHGSSFVPPIQFLDIIQSLGFITTLKIRHRRHAHFSGDPQYACHTDTFHPTLKIWIFNHDVDLDKGPFHFAPGTQRLRKDKFEFLNHITNYVIDEGIDKTNPLYDHGSFRITDDLKNSLHFKAYTGNRHMVVFADPCGFHYRGEARPGTLRDTFYVLPERTNVFPPMEECLKYEDEQVVLEQVLNGGFV